MSVSKPCKRIKHGNYTLSPSELNYNNNKQKCIGLILCTDRRFQTETWRVLFFVFLFFWGGSNLSCACWPFAISSISCFFAALLYCSYFWKEFHTPFNMFLQKQLIFIFDVICLFVLFFVCLFLWWYWNKDLYDLIWYDMNKNAKKQTKKKQLWPCVLNC